MNETTETTTPTTAPRKWAADTTNPPGKLQANAFNGALRKLSWQHNNRKEISGVIGGESHTMTFNELFGVNRREDVAAVQQAIGDKYNWTVSRTNAAAIRSDIEASLPELEKNIPVVDKRITVEQDAANQAERQAREDAQKAEQARKAALLPEPPKGNYQTGTIRRDLVRRLVEDGKLVLIDSYHFDDMTGSDRGVDKPLPVAIAPANWQDRKEGVAYVHASDFDGGSGHASQGANGDITLYVHSNCNYTFRRVAGAVSEAQPEAAGGTVGTVRRNLEHDGVEVAFPAKPAREVIDRLKANGFRWSMRSKVWYKKFSEYAWARACEIAGVKPQDVSSTGNRVDATDSHLTGDDGAAAYVEAQEQAFQDRAAEVCGA